MYGFSLRMLIYDTGNEDVVVSNCHGTKEEVFFGYFYEVFVHATVLFGLAAQEHVLLEVSVGFQVKLEKKENLWQVLIGRIGHCSQSKHLI